MATKTNAKFAGFLCKIDLLFVFIVCVRFRCQLKSLDLFYKNNVAYNNKSTMFMQLIIYTII